MSDEPSTELSSESSSDLSTELSAELRELAARQESRPVLTGAEIRGRAVRRGRRRVVGTLGAGAVAVALVASALTLGFTGFTGSEGSSGDGNEGQLPAATHALPSHPSPRVTSGAASTPAPRAVAVGTVALGKRALIVGDRVMPLTSGLPDSRKLVGPLTVYKKHETKVVTVTELTDGTAYTTEVSLAVELRDAHNEPVYVGVAYSSKEKSTGKYGTGGSWMGLDPTDAKWFYEDAKIGSVLSVTGSMS
ncbi:hypothetical protein OG824_12425 [Streptomyces prunicolor]|uniref:hypothetical protein n=1 Tax=Streptomyces prunicolor TaxID=67348 RepID=UPI00225705C9|nr:hypothetical protein [Streptomyces prunicolor]MCX5236006.1 hypothetical protein [Streptomyces prunicolor]